MEDFSFLEEYLKKEIAKLDNVIQSDNEKLETFESLKKIITQIETNPKDIDMSTFRKNLSLYLSEQEVENYCNELIYIKDIHSDVYDPELEERDLTKGAIQFIKKFREKLEIFVKNNGSKYGKISFEIKENVKRKEFLENYLKIIKNGKLTRPLSKEETNQLFEELENSNLDKKDLLELMKRIIKHNLEHSISVKNIKETIIESKIEKNATIVREILNGQSKKKFEFPTISITEMIRQEVSKTEELSQEEKNIINKINSLTVRKSGNLPVDIEILCKRLSGDLSLNERKKLYVKNNRFNWELIAEDIRTNLLSNLNINKEEVFVIFKYILDCVEKEENIQKQSYIYRNILTEQLNKIRKIFEQKATIIQEYSNLREQEKNYRKYIHTMIETGNAKELNKDDYNKIGEVTFMLSIYPELVELEEIVKEAIMDEIISEENYEFLNTEANNLIEQYNKLLEEQREREEQNKSVEPVDEFDIPKLDIKEYNIKNTKNILLMLKNHEGNFCAEEGLDGTYDMKNYLIKKEALARIIDIFQKLYYNSEYRVHFTDRNNGDGPVEETGKTGKDKYDEELKPRRCWPPGKGRVCYIKIPICKENLKKIYLIYNNKNFMNEEYAKEPCVFMLVEAGVVLGASHADYDDFNRSMRKNKDYIRKIKSLFENPDTPVEVLTKIIDESSEVCKKYTTPEGLSPEGRRKK